MKKEDRKIYTAEEAIEFAVKATKNLGMSDYYERQIIAAEKRGYQKAIEDMQAKLNKMFHI